MQETQNKFKHFKFITMKTFEIEVSGNTLDDVLLAIDEVRKKIADGFTTGFDQNDDGQFEFTSNGDYDDDKSDDDYERETPAERQQRWDDYDEEDAYRREAEG